MTSAAPPGRNSLFDAALQNYTQNQAMAQAQTQSQLLAQMQLHGFDQSLPQGRPGGTTPSAMPIPQRAPQAFTSTSAMFDATGYSQPGSGSQAQFDMFGQTSSPSVNFDMGVDAALLNDLFGGSYGNSSNGAGPSRSYGQQQQYQQYQQPTPLSYSPEMSLNGEMQYRPVASRSNSFTTATAAPATVNESAGMGGSTWGTDETAMLGPRPGAGMGSVGQSRTYSDTRPNETRHGDMAPPPPPIPMPPGPQRPLDANQNRSFFGSF